MAKQVIELKSAVRFSVVFKYFGQLCIVLATLTLVPLVMSVIFGELTISLRYGIVVGMLAVFGASLDRLQTPLRLQANEGMVLVGLIYLLTSLVMSYPMMGSGLGFLDALFEVISGITTTGLSTTATLVGASSTFLFGRAWMQWYGGLGILVFSLAFFLIQPGLFAKSLAVTETDPDNLIGGIRAHTRRVLIVYIILTILGIIGSLLLGMKFFDALLYIFTAVSTAGFSPYDSSLAMLNWKAQVWITLFCLAGAIPLMLFYRLLTRKMRVAIDFLQLKAILIASLVVSLAVGILMRISSGIAWTQVLHHAPLLAISAQTNTGFSSMSVAQLDAGSKLVLIFSMIVGGGTGSTAGGFKLVRLMIVASVLRLILLRTCLPQHAVIEPRLAGRRLLDREIHATLIIIMTFFTVVAFSWLPFVAMGYNPLDSLFEVVSATATTGLSVGLTSPKLPAVLKLILCVDMLMGRLEIIAWLVMLYPGTWFGKRMEVT